MGIRFNRYAHFSATVLPIIQGVRCNYGLTLCFNIYRKKRFITKRTCRNPMFPATRRQRPKISRAPAFQILLKTPISRTTLLFQCGFETLYWVSFLSTATRGALYATKPQTLNWLISPRRFSLSRASS